MRLLWSLILLSGFPEIQARLLKSAQKRDNGYDTPTETIDPKASDHDHEFHTFITRPDIDAPRWDITVYDEDALAPGYWFIAPYEQADQTARGEGWVGPHIYDQKGELIWSGVPMLNGFDVFGFTKTTFEGKDMLSMVYRHQYGAILDESYRIHQKAHVESGFDYNMHEFNIVENGTRLLMMRTKTKQTSTEISSQVGYDGNCNVRFYGFEERDAQTMEPTFTWLSEGHIPLDDTMMDDRPMEDFCTDPDGWDYLHCNSIDKFFDGDFLLGCRHSDTVYKISHIDGSIVWRLGGKRSDFDFEGLKGQWKDDYNQRFSGQHDVKVLESKELRAKISMLDNAWRPGRDKQSNDYSRGLIVMVRMDRDRARVLSEYPHPSGELVHGRGSMQVLENGNAFCGFTQHAFIAEYAHDGRLLMEAQVRPNTRSYRSYKHTWVGRPVLPPDVYSVAFPDEEGKDFKTVIYVSWNGATEVMTWKFYAAKANGSKGKLLASAPKTGFETSITHEGYASQVIAEAIDRDGNVIGTSDITTTIRPTGLIDGLGVQEVEWLEDHVPAAAILFRNSIVAFISGVVVCAAACATIWTVWRLRRWRPRPVAWWKQRRNISASENGNGSEHLLGKHGASEEDFVLDEEGADSLELVQRSHDKGPYD